MRACDDGLQRSQEEGAVGVIGGDGEAGVPSRGAMGEGSWECHALWSGHGGNNIADLLFQDLTRNLHGLPASWWRLLLLPLIGMPFIFMMYAYEKPSIIGDRYAHGNKTEAKILLCG
jgi:hypothetical protein